MSEKLGLCTGNYTKNKVLIKIKPNKEIVSATAQKVKFSIKDFLSKYDQIPGNCGAVFCAQHVEICKNHSE